MTIVVTRHGETEWSAEGRHTGRTDIPLTDKGREEALHLRPFFARWHFAKVLVSPLQRARATCDLAGLDDRAEVCDDLMEWDYGKYDGMTTAEVRLQSPNWQLWRDGPPGGETIEQVGARADRVLSKIADIHGDVALFAHGHILRVLTARWLGLPPKDGKLFALQPARPSQLGHEHEYRVILEWNTQP